MGFYHVFALNPVISAATGTNQFFTGDNLRLNFASITGAGDVSYTAIDPSVVSGNYTVPVGYAIQSNQPAYNVTTTAATSGNIDVCIANINEFDQTSFNKLKILQSEGANWVDRTFSSSFVRREICARVSTLSNFVVASYLSFRTQFDFDADTKADFSIFRPSSGEWWYLRSGNGGNYAAKFGTATDKLTPSDFTGDGKTDIAFWRPSTGEWFVLRSEDGSFYSYPFGTNGDIPIVGDFDVDDKADSGVFRPSNSTWYIKRSSDGGVIIQQFGQTGDAPVVADYDGDNKSDLAVYRPSNGQWWINRSSAGVIVYQFGSSSDKPTQGDFTGDGKADAAFFRPSTGEWFVLRSENQSYYSFPYGTNGDIPVPADYDGDGKTDAAVFRPSNSTWFVNKSTGGNLIQTFGQSGDKPVPNAFVP